MSWYLGLKTHRPSPRWRSSGPSALWWKWRASVSTRTTSSSTLLYLCQRGRRRSGTSFATSGREYSVNSARILKLNAWQQIVSSRNSRPAVCMTVFAATQAGVHPSWQQGSSHCRLLRSRSDWSGKSNTGPNHQVNALFNLLIFCLPLTCHNIFRNYIFQI